VSKITLLRKAEPPDRFYTVRQKKLHRFIFAIALSELHLLWQCLAHVYINKFSITCMLYILYIIRDGEPA